jgi:hypothetical protein
MLEQLRSWGMDLLRVPPEPAVPVGERALRVFRAAPNFYRYSLIVWGSKQLGALIGLIVGVLVLRHLPDRIPGIGVPNFVFWIEIGAWITFLVQLPFTFAMLRLDYEMRWYILGERSLRIREGLNRVREQTMTFANVQNMSVRQGPLQRILGIADLEVHTAGGGGGGSDSSGSEKTTHHGVLHGIADAAGIRDAIRTQVRAFRDAGLGDPDDHAPRAARIRGDGGASGEDGIPLLEAARECLAEARLLRAAVSTPR